MDAEEYADHTIQQYSGVMPRMLEEALESTGWHSLLDLGCGDGALLYAMRERGLLDEKHVFAVDLSEKRIESVSRLFTGVRCYVADVCNLEGIPDGSIDFLVSTQVIEHVSSDEEMVREVARVLAEGGTAYVSTIFKKRYGWYFYRNSGRWVLDPTHVREYTSEAELTGIIEKQGLRVLRDVKTQLCYPLIDPLLKRYGGRGYVVRRPALRLLRKIVVPIPGYSNWELLLRKDKSLR